MGTARIFQWFGQELDSSAPPAAVAAENSGGAAPSNGVVVRRQFRGFDSAADEVIILRFVLPSNYVSGGTLTFQWSSNATSGNVIWKTAYALSVPSTTDFDGVVFGTVTAAAAQATSATAGVEVTKAIDLGVSAATAGAVLYVMLGRDADNASDTVNANDAELCEPWLLTFTTT